MVCLLIETMYMPTNTFLIIRDVARADNECRRFVVAFDLGTSRSAYAFFSVQGLAEEEDVIIASPRAACRAWRR